MSNEEDNPWNNKDSNPWVKNKQDPIQDLYSKFKNFKFGGNKNNEGGGQFPHIIIGLFVIVLIWLGSGVFQISPDERGVVLRFGRSVRTCGSGLHYRLPYPFEETLIKSVTTINRIDIGTKKGRSSGDEATWEEGSMLTGDSNLANVTFTVLWRIKDDGVEEYLFNARSPDITVGAVAESIMREIIGQTPIAFAQTEGRGEINNRAQKRLQDIMDEYKMGVEIVQVQLQNVEPPASVIDSFRDVERAQADQQREINQADAYARDIMARARGQAGELINKAQARSSVIISRAKGLGQRFSYILGQYESSPMVTSKRIYIETMEEILENMQKIIVDQKQTAGTVAYLPLHEMLGANKKAK